jgi:predicted porin
MKKSLLALAVLGAFAGAASAQSSVTLYGRVDLSVGKNLGSATKVLQNGSGSRLGFRGVEDLGGGLKAIFNIEHRFNADTGAMSDTNRMWGARSLVGLQGGFGQVTLGREYTTSFLMSQLINDPWGYDTVTAAAVTRVTGLNIAKVRNDNAITYNVAAAGLNFGLQTAETDAQAPSTTPLKSRPVNFAVNGTFGPVAFNASYEKTGEVGGAKITSVAGYYDLGVVRLGLNLTSGDAATTGQKRKGYLLTATAPVGAGQFRAALGERKDAGVKTTEVVALGYHYSLSKRTTVYADFVTNNKLTTEKNGYDFGLKHNF